MTVHASDAYKLAIRLPPPDDYPVVSRPDTFKTTPLTADYETRRQAFLQHIVSNPSPRNLKASFYELARLAAGGTPHEGVMHAALDFIDVRKDCADFVLHSIIRLLYQYRDHGWGMGVLSHARETVLGFKYWPDEPGLDSLCTWTENHQILFNSGAYLMGQMYPNDVFKNSRQTGREKMDDTRPRILRWLEMRYRTGFSEWLSHVYYDEDITALVSLIDFCEDGEIVQKSRMVLDLILLDMALNSFRGVFGSTHGRSYENTKKWAREEGTTDTMKLLFGMGIFGGFDNMSAVSLALSTNYRMPRVIYDIATDLTRAEMANRQKSGIRVNEASNFDLRFDNLEDGMYWLSMEAYAHPKTINLTMAMFDRFNWWENGFFTMFKQRRSLVDTLRASNTLGLAARIFDRDLNRNTREAVNIYTYRTPDYMLSSAQDYRPGYGGDQQHIWQASLGENANVFTTHPARREGKSPNYWTGNGTLPRVAQVENVAIIIYNINTRPGLYLTHRLEFTHAWFPKDQFDEVFERLGWVFGRKGWAYIALRSHRPYTWQTAEGEDEQREMIADGRQNVWVCEMGRRPVDGNFTDFIDRILAASLEFEPLGVRYRSPTQGELSFKWRGPLIQNGEKVALGDYPRYDNPYVQAARPAEKIDVRLGDAFLSLDWATRTRDLSGTV